MNKYVIVTFLLILSACKAKKTETKKIISSNFEIVKSPIIVENDTIIVNELRFYKIQSAMDGMKLMYQNYGKWNAKTFGKHQSNIKRIIWQDFKLFDNENEIFTVVADGTETKSESFACLIVFDSKEKDCFEFNHPYREKLTELFKEKMENMDNDYSVYQLFR